MKKIMLFSVVALFACSAVWADTFVNGGFETGDLTGWTGAGGVWYGYPAPPVNPNLYSGLSNNTIMSAGTDPITGANTVYNGNYSVRVNELQQQFSINHSAIRAWLSG